MMNNPPYVLELTNVNKSFNGKPILNKINWKVGPGERWVVFGLNGSGKTTLLTLISGFQAISSGDLHLFGQPYNQENITDLRRKVALVSHSFFGKIYTKETLRDILLSRLGNGLQGHLKASIYDEGQALKQLDCLGLGDYLDYPFNFLSKGEQQKALFARALLFSSKLLCLDEVTSGMDILMRKKVLALLREYKDTVIYVTHHPEEISDFFTHILLLKRGRIYRQGSLEEVFTNENLSQFLNEPVVLKRDPYGCHIL